MKVKVEIELDIPDSGVVGLLETEIQDAVYENLITYAVTSHLRDTMNWMSKKGLPENTPEFDRGCENIIRVHKTWTDILDTSKSTVTIIKD